MTRLVQVVGKQRFKNPSRDLKAIGINVYGGGFTIGVLKHFHVLSQLEEIKLGRRSFLLNFPDIFSPLCAWDKWPIKEHIGQVDLVYANPPCVPWSAASSYSERTGQVGTRSGKKLEHRFEDPLLKLTEHTMRTALKLRPKVFISESVENAYNIGASHYDPYVRAWKKAGYAVTYFLTDAVIHGAPCRRRRFHFIAHQMELVLPAPPKVKRVTTVRQAIEDLVDHPLLADGTFQHEEASAGAWGKPAYRKWLGRVPHLGTLRSVLPETFKASGKTMPSVFARRLAWDMPSGTIMGFNKLIHPDGQRWITYREGMRLMTYPDEFRIAGHSDVDAYDAVIPLIGEFLAGVARKSIEQAWTVKPVHTVVDWRPLGVGHSGKKAYEASLSGVLASANL